MCRRERSCSRVLGRPGTLTTSANVACVRLRTPKRAKTLVCPATNQRLETKANGVGIGLGTRSRPGIAEQMLVDMQRLLHTYHYAILVWQRRSIRPES